MLINITSMLHQCYIDDEDLILAFTIASFEIYNFQIFQVQVIITT